MTCVLVDDAYRTLRGEAFWEWLLRAGQWATEGLMPRPAPGTILAEAPPFPMDSIQSKTFVVTNDTALPFPVDLEHRDGANAATVRARAAGCRPRALDGHHHLDDRRAHGRALADPGCLMADGVQGSIIRGYGTHLGMRPEHVPPAVTIVATSLDPGAPPAPPANFRIADRLGPLLLAALAAPPPLERRTMMRTLALGILLALAAWPAWAQPPASIAVDIETATFQWDWTKGTGGDIEEWHVVCARDGTTPVEVVHVVSDPAARSIAVKQVVGETGNYACTVMAVNTFGKSGPSNQVVFQAGTLPAAPTNLRIQSPQ